MASIKVKSDGAVGKAPQVPSNTTVPDTRGFSSLKVGDIEIKFQPGKDVANRLVVFPSGATVKMQPGTNRQPMIIDGAEVRIAKGRLFIDGQEAKLNPAKAEPKDKVIHATGPAPTPAQAKRNAARDSEGAKATGSVQSTRQVFSVDDSLATRTDVKRLLKGTSVSAPQIQKLIEGGASPVEIEKQLVDGGLGPLSDLLTPEAMKTLLSALPAGEHTFLQNGIRLLPPDMSSKMTSAELERRTGVPAEDQLEALMKTGLSSYDALQQLLAPLTPQTQAPQSTITPPPPETLVADAPAASKPADEAAMLNQLSKIPAFKQALAATQGRAVTADDMSAMIQAVGPEGLKSLGSAVVFGTGGISDRLTSDAMDTFLRAVHERSNGATAGMVPPNVYGQQSQWTGTASYATNGLQFLQDPRLQYVAQTYGNGGLGTFAVNNILPLVGNNMTSFGNNFLYGGGNYFNPAMYTGYTGTGLWGLPQTGKQVASTLLGSAIGGAVVGGLSALAFGGGYGGWGGFGGYGGWGGGYGGLFNGAGMWGLGTSMWNAFPGNAMGYGMMGLGYNWASSMFW